MIERVNDTEIEEYKYISGKLDSLRLLRMALTGSNNRYGDFKPKFYKGESFRFKPLYLLNRFLNLFGYTVCTYEHYDEFKREHGRDHPAYADTMCGIKRLESIEMIIRDIINKKVQGDFLMAGVWRGGAAVYMQAVQKQLNENRTIWLADSFEGLPKPISEHDKGDELWKVGYLSVPTTIVRTNFHKYGLLDTNIGFLKGWFKDTLPNIQSEKLSFIYADGDLYESTMDILNNCYHLLEPGGYIVIDDYYSMPACKIAVDEFRETHGITELMTDIDYDAVYWMKN